MLPPDGPSLEDLVESCRSLEDLVGVWRRAKPGFTAPITLRQRAQLKQFAVRIGNMEVAARTVVWACRNWATLMAATGTRKTPHLPHVGWLLSCIDEAVNMAIQEVRTSEPVPERAVLPKIERRPDLSEEELAQERAMLLDD